MALVAGLQLPPFVFAVVQAVLLCLAALYAFFWSRALDKKEDEIKQIKVDFGDQKARLRTECHEKISRTARVALRTENSVREAVHDLRQHSISPLAPTDGRPYIKRLARDLRQCVDEIATYFTDLTGTQCACCVKYVGLDGKVMTLLRDAASKHRERQINGSLLKYDYSANTAFHGILKHIWGMTSALTKEKEGVVYFLCNDLRSLGDDYRNANPNWQQHYNSTLVVPVWDGIEPESEDLFPDAAGARLVDKLGLRGFLCVDSLRAEFNEDGHVYLVGMAGFRFYEFIQAIFERAEEEASDSASVVYQDAEAHQLSEAAEEGPDYEPRKVSPQTRSATLKSDSKGTGHEQDG